MRLLRCAGSLAILLACTTSPVFGQSAVEGSIRGYVKDEQGAVLPGVVVERLGPSGLASAKTDDAGAFRLLNVPPGEYTIAARADGFTDYQRDGVIVRTGMNIGIDIVMKVGAVTENVAVSLPTPLVDTSRATQAVSISGDLERGVPVSLSRNWADFLGLTPGMILSSQNTTVDSYALHGSDFASHVIQIDGADMSAVQQNATSFVNLASEVIEDVEIKTAAVDASSPLGVGAVISLATKSGTDAVHGAAGATVQRRSWASNNNPGGTVAALDAFRPDLSVGGPIRRNSLWFFGAFRRDDVSAGVTRTPQQIATLQALDADFEPFSARIIGNYVFGKMTAERGRHRADASYHYDPQKRDSVSAVDTRRFSEQILGGSRNVNARVASVWTDSLLTRIGVSYNNKAQQLKSGTDATSRIVFATSIMSSGRRTGSTQVAVFDNGLSGLSFEQPHQRWTVTADATFYSAAGPGNHQWQAGLYVQPRNHQEVLQTFANGGRTKEESVLRDAANPPLGALPYYREVYDAPEGVQSLTDSRDVALYVQDTWALTSRLTVTAGVRVDAIRRVDELFDVVVQNKTDVGPRLGAVYQLSQSGKDVARASWVRVHDLLSTNAATAGTNTAGKRDLYDLDLNGTFETELVTPPSTLLATNRIIDLERGQPFVDEWNVGYTRQLAGGVRTDVGFVHRKYRDRTALVEVNGIYGNGLFSGYRDERFNEIYRLTSNIWNTPVYSGLEIQMSKRTAVTQLIGSYTRGWQRIEGTWQPNDPASFIQPGAFPNNKGIGSVRAVTTAANDANSLSGTHMTGNGGWRDHAVRLGAFYRAPWGILLGTSYAFQSGADSGPIIARVAAAGRVNDFETTWFSNLL